MQTEKFSLMGSKGKVVAVITAADPNSQDCDEGVWLEVQADDGSKPTLCLIKRKDGSWYLGVYRDANHAHACDLSVLFDKEEGPTLQVAKGKDVVTTKLFDLIKRLEG